MNDRNDSGGLFGNRNSGSGGTVRLTVTEFTRLIKEFIETNFPTVAIEGEISNYVHHTSGHRYFTLKDENSQLRCVMFRWQAQSRVKKCKLGNVKLSVPCSKCRELQWMSIR